MCLHLFMDYFRHQFMEVSNRLRTSMDSIWGMINGVDRVVMVTVASMDGSRQEVQECNRWMKRKAKSDGDGLKRHISFYDYFILCCFSSSIGLRIGAAFCSCERDFWHCLLSTFGVGGHLWNRLAC
ncbi:hypothetical protein Hanom_Chr07g00657431 [Helianthus anomalus]